MKNNPNPVYCGCCKYHKEGHKSYLHHCFHPQHQIHWKTFLDSGVYPGECEKINKYNNCKSYELYVHVPLIRRLLNHLLNTQQNSGEKHE